jgi:hypothetical protein
MDRTTPNALAPLEFILGIAGTLMLLGLVLSVPLIVFGNGSFLGVGDREVCVSAPIGALDLNSGGQMHVHADQYEDVNIRATHAELCDLSPTTTQRVWSAVAAFPDYFYALGFVGFAWLLTRVARRRGLFSPHVALGVGHLGLFVLIGALVVSLLRLWGEEELFLTMVDTSRSGLWFYFFHLSWTSLFAGFGLLTVGRVMAQSVRLQREIDATV